MLNNIIWYDKISKIYDLITYRFYKKPRISLIDNLKIKNKDRVLIIACGTGQSFKLIENKIGEKGEIIAIDYSKGMLRQANNRIKKNNWSNIKLIHLDVRKLDRNFLENEKIKSDFDILIGELAFTVVPDWEKVLQTSIGLLKPTGKIGLLDWYRKYNDWITAMVDFIAEAKTTRDTISCTKRYIKKFEVKRKFFFKNIYVAIGEKK